MFMGWKGCRQQGDTRKYRDRHPWIKRNFPLPSSKMEPKATHHPLPIRIGITRQTWAKKISEKYIKNL
jgi:hypothetical protein